MSTYIIGDVQGCFDTLSRLLGEVRFDRNRDQLVFVGDLVNRGPRSLEVLRFCHGLGSRARVVLGNHDLHLVHRYYARARARGRDTLDKVLAAVDGALLLDWLRRQPLVIELDAAIVVHAGVLPAWSAAEALRLGDEVSRELAAERRPTQLILNALEHRGAEPWQPSLRGVDRLASILSVLTRMRCMREDGSLCHSWKGAPESAPAGCRPWFSYPTARDKRVVFGHWAALGVRRGPLWAGLDSGCVWGQKLTALRLETDELISVDSVEGGTRDDD